MKNHILSYLVAALLAASPASADTVNFTQLAGGDLGSGALTVDGVTFIGSPNLYNASGNHFPNEGGAICSLDPIAFDCANDMTVKFNGKVKRLKLATSGYDAGDSVTIAVYRGSQLLGSTTVTSDGGISLRSFGKVTKLVFDDNSTGAGYAYGKFKFRRVTTTAKDDQDGKKRHSGKANRALTQ